MKPINLEEVKPEELLKIFKKYKIESEMDSDGDIRIEGTPSLFLKINEESSQIKFFGSIPINQDNPSRDDGENFAQVLSMIHKFVKFSYIENKIGNGVFLESFLLKKGIVDEGYIIEFYQETRKSVSSALALTPHIHELKRIKKD